MFNKNKYYNNHTGCFSTHILGGGGGLRLFFVLFGSLKADLPPVETFYEVYLFRFM